MSIGTTIEKQFQWYAPSIKKSNYKLNDDGTLTIEGIASTTNKDLQGDIVLPTAIESMKQQLTFVLLRYRDINETTSLGCLSRLV